MSDKPALLFGPILQAARLAAGLSQAQLAAAANVPLGTLCGYEQGYRLPNTAVFMLLCEALALELPTAFKPVAAAARAAAAARKPRRRARAKK